MTTDQAYSETGFQKIEVDIKSLSDFAHALRREFQENLLPAWERIGPTLDQGAQFGFSDTERKRPIRSRLPITLTS